MRLRLALALSFMGLVTACGGDSSEGVGTGGSASTALRSDALSQLTLRSEAVVDGVVRAVTSDAGALVVTIEVQQTLWSQAGLPAVSGTFTFEQAAGGADEAPQVGEENIVFLIREGTGWAAVDGARGRFRVADGVVTPVAADGVDLPADTDVASFASLLAPEPAPSSDDTGSGYGGYGGYGGGSY